MFVSYTDLFVYFKGLSIWGGIDTVTVFWKKIQDNPHLTLYTDIHCNGLFKCVDKLSSC